MKISEHFHYFIVINYLSNSKVSEMRRFLESIQILKNMRVLKMLCCVIYSHMIFMKDYVHVHLTANSCSWQLHLLLNSFFTFFQYSVLCIVKAVVIVGCSSSVWMLWGSDRGSDIVNMWSVGLEVVREEDNLILQGEEVKASLCAGRRKFKKSSHSHCGRGETARDGDSEVVRVMEDDGRKVLRVG